MNNVERYLKFVKPYAYAVYKKYGILPSVVAAHSATESSWGTSLLSTRENNFFGLKGGDVSYNTGEFLNGGYTTIIDGFRKFNNPGESFDDYGNRLTNNSIYKPYKITAQDNASYQVMQLHNSPWATDPNQYSTLMSIIRANNLEAWDLDAKNGGTAGLPEDFSMSGLPSLGGGGSFDPKQHKNYKEDFLDKSSTKGASARPGTKLKAIQGIVIHDIRNSGNLQTVKKALEAGNSSVGYHFIVSETDAIQLVPTDEKVIHAERGKSLIGGMLRPNDYTLSIGVVTSNPRVQFSTKLNVRLSLVIAEICRDKKIPATAIQPAWRVDGVQEPVNWYNNAFLYTAFIGMVEHAISTGANIAENPNYNSGSTNGPATGLPINGRGVIPKMIKRAQELLGTLFYTQDFAYRKSSNIKPGDGADCSSFCHYLFEEFVNIDIGGDTGAQVNTKYAIKKIHSIDDLRAGDLAFWGDEGWRPAHVGFIVGKYQMIDHGGPGSGPNLKNINTPFHRGWWNVGVRIFSDTDYEESQTPATPEKPSIDANGSYIMQVKVPMNATDAPSTEGGVSTKRLIPGEVHRVAEIRTTEIKLANGLWVPRLTDNASFMKVDSPSTPIGVTSTLAAVNAYTRPSFTAEPIIEYDRPKVIAASETMPIYAINNGFSQIKQFTPNSIEGEWIINSPSYVTTNLSGLGTLEENKDKDLIFEEGKVVETTIEGRCLPEDFNNESGYQISRQVEGIVAHKDLLPIGAEVEVEIPLMPEYSKRYYVISNNIKTTDPNNLELLLPTPVKAYNFGKRNGKFQLKQRNNPFIIGGLLKQWEEDANES